MSSINPKTIEQLWQATKGSNWHSLIQGLDEIFSAQLIDNAEYDQMIWVIGKLESKGVDFPTTSKELQLRLDYYL